MLGAVLRRAEAMLVASAAAVALLLVGKAAALAALVHLVFTGTSDATVHFLIVIVSFVGAWSVLSSVHRAAVIAVVTRDATSVSSATSPRRGRAST